MPAIITHDQFGKSALERGVAPFAGDRRTREAFLLGNQGPDPLFYCIVNPTLAPYRPLGGRMHRDKPAELLLAVTRSIENVPAASQDVARAWAAGFLCHYLLDRTAHPLVYAQQHAFCNAGVEGLTERDGSEVHAVIESEIDEMMLYTRCGRTVATFRPHKEILRCDEQALAAISYLVSLAVAQAYGETVRPDLYAKSVHAFRRVQGTAFHSPRGVKRAIVGTAERLVRRHSFAQAMTHRPLPLTHSAYDNHDHRTWENPFTHVTSTASFEELFEQALGEANEGVGLLLGGGFDAESAKRIVGGLDFSGKPTEG